MLGRPVAPLLSTVALGAVALVGGAAVEVGWPTSFGEPAADPGGSQGKNQAPPNGAMSVKLTGPPVVVSEGTGTLHLTTSAPPRATNTGGEVEWQSRAAGTSVWRTFETLELDREGRASVQVSPWKATEYRAVVRGRHAATGISTPFRVSTRPAAEPVVVPKRAAEPRFSSSTDPARRPRAVGAGAHASVSRIPGPVWERMTGVSYTEGCPVGRDDLRYVQVNHWGFDGYRYRGEIIVHASVAQQTAAVFTDLYRLKYPIRQMRLVDDFGNGSVRGANDYSSMSADNTSAFNCRFVDGWESRRVLSPHAWGLAIDINTWENPFQARTGVFPNRAYLDRRLPHEAVLGSLKSPVVRAFESRGLRWGGRWAARDYHHFEAPRIKRKQRQGR
ncbi:M15 family metallopeptidase [Streptomyces sp. NPDC059176]|uniref:M15 family metallopeptidase n=1 Tax=unclassified Streptomyces TaxID=2593676 RepID=UPI0036923F4A